MVHRLVLLRHGQSTWNLENRFTGWTNVDLTKQGVSEAKMAGRLMAAEGFTFDLAFTSLLLRATRTLSLALEEMSLPELEVRQDWRLNERHYGALQGLNKAETAAEHGEEAVHRWRRSYDTPPPALDRDDPRHPANDAAYTGFAPEILPATECLKDVVDRVVPFWDAEIAPRIRSGQNLILAAHGNSLRAMVKYLDGISDEEIPALNIPTGVPLVYDLDTNLRPISRRYLGDAEAVKAAEQAVANQGKAG